MSAVRQTVSSTASIKRATSAAESTTGSVFGFLA
jgi:hypothetical protein